MLKRYKTLPNLPSDLSENGKDFFKLYCYYFLEREALTEDMVPSIETLAYLEQQRVTLQKDINKSRDEENIKHLNQIVTQIRMLKREMHIKIDKSTFKNPNSEDKGANKTPLKGKEF